MEQPQATGRFRGLKRTQAKALVVVTVLVTGIGVAGAGAGAQADTAAADVGSFDANGVAGVVDFQYQYAKIGIVPFTVQGGMLESFSDASSSGNASGVAGPAPIPLLANGSLANPTNDPITGHEVPEEIRNGYSKIDFQRLPNGCRSQYPDLYGDGGDEANCGGPASNDPALGFTFGAANGHTKAQGDPKDALKTKSLSTSRGTDIGLPALQAKIHEAWAESRSGMNKDSLAESSGIVDLSGVEILGGLIKIAGVHSEAIATTGGTEANSKTTTAFTIHDAFVAGFPVVIGPDGVTVDKQKTPAVSLADANKAVNDALSKADIGIRLAPPPVPTKNGSQVSIQSSGIEIINRGQQVTPANSYYRFPYVFAAANAAPADAGTGTGTDDLSGGAGTSGGGSFPASRQSAGTSSSTNGASSTTAEPATPSDLGGDAVDTGALPAGPGDTAGTVLDSGPSDATASGAGSASASDSTAPAESASAPTARLHPARAPRRYVAAPAALVAPRPEMKDLAGMLAAVGFVVAGGLFLRRVLL